MAPETVRADGGVIMAGGKRPAKGILIDGVVIEDALLVEYMESGGKERKIDGEGTYVSASVGRL